MNSNLNGSKSTKGEHLVPSQSHVRVVRHTAVVTPYKLPKLN